MATAADSQGDEASEKPLPQPSQTPFFRATQSARYRRQEHIRDIEAVTGRTLICYVSGAAAYVERDDVLALTDLLYKVNPGTSLDLMLHTMGGDVDAAEKIAGLLLKAVEPDGELRVIVPDCAKSAGTLISLAARSIMMSDTSELGPIDPQIVTISSDGTRNNRPAQSYIDGFEDLLKRIHEGGPDAAALQQLMIKFDPTFLDICHKARSRSQQFAEKLLRDGMFYKMTHRLSGETVNITDIASKLNSNANWLSHGAVISADQAREIGLRIDYRDEHSNEWQAYWRLYCEMRFALRSDGEKLFESNYASLHM